MKLFFFSCLFLRVLDRSRQQVYTAHTHQSIQRIRNHPEGGKKAHFKGFFAPKDLSILADTKKNCEEFICSMFFPPQKQELYACKEKQRELNARQYEGVLHTSHMK
ncbi:hypothetical protein FQA47_006686 [Oryzias melastigma]|uniref:GIY-YIG domain-containing protein n=1 Tax=Oryzias melastigma TaxID=30732 RepID=A0A834BWN9_ORYME|nr:hypothetical protein FQA47_006686 [Oryzias melastigma]